VVMVAGLAATAPGFATLGNVLNVLRTVSMLGTIAFAMTAVVISGDIDLSVGTGVALVGCIVAWVAGKFADTVGGAAAIALGSAFAIGVGAALGCTTGKIRHWFNVPTFITTLALFAALRGGANLTSGGFPLATFPEWFDFFGGGYLLFVPFPVYVLAAVFFCMLFLMEYTPFGRAICAVGGNMGAARLLGINVWGVKVATLAITSALTAISGILIASQIGSGIGTTATGTELDVIAVTIIGGTSLFGGNGRIWGRLVGVLFLGGIANGTTQLNVNEYWQYVARGPAILGAPLMNQVLERWR